MGSDSSSSLASMLIPILQTCGKAHVLVGHSQPPLRPERQRLPVFGVAFVTFAVDTIIVFKLLIAAPTTLARMGRLSTHF